MALSDDSLHQSFDHSSTLLGGVTKALHPLLTEVASPTVIDGILPQREAGQPIFPGCFLLKDATSQLNISSCFRSDWAKYLPIGLAFIIFHHRRPRPSFHLVSVDTIYSWTLGHRRQSLQFE